MKKHYKILNSGQLGSWGVQRPGVGKPINANPRLSLNQGFHLACLKWFKMPISN